MHDMCLNKLNDFIQVLDSRRKHHAKNGDFLVHILFTTIYLMYEYKLNHRNHSGQEIIRSNFI
jgi:hypothetical protein